VACIPVTHLDHLQPSRPTPIRPLKAPVSIFHPSIHYTVWPFTEKFCGRTRRTPLMSGGDEISQSIPSILRRMEGSPMLMTHPSPPERKRHWSHPLSLPRGSSHPLIPSDSADRSGLGGMSSNNPPRYSVHRPRARLALLVQCQERT